MINVWRAYNSANETLLDAIKSSNKNVQIISLLSVSKSLVVS